MKRSKKKLLKKLAENPQLKITPPQPRKLLTLTEFMVRQANKKYAKYSERHDRRTIKAENIKKAKKEAIRLVKEAKQARLTKRATRLSQASE